VTNSTVAGNSTGAGNGGVFYAVNALVRNSLIVDNTGGDADGGMLATGSHNITGAFTFADPDPTMPQDHGGPTRTLALIQGSAAIGGGDPAICAQPLPPPILFGGSFGSNNGPGGIDQRGVARPATACDIGAYESPGKRLAVAAPLGHGPDGAVPVTVTATDGFGGVMTGYRGTVRVSSTDPAGAAVTYQFTAADAGRHTFPALFATAGDWTVTATDTALTGTGSVHVPLVVMSLSPNSGDTHGGGTVTITVANLGTHPSGINVMFGAVAAPVVQVAGTTVTVQAPPHAEGPVDVAVMENGLRAVQEEGYTYGTLTVRPPPQPAVGGAGTPPSLPGSRPAGPSQPGGPNPLPAGR
jgi:hypothetical protein